MPGLRRLSGRDVVAILHTFGFEVTSQRGSHIKLRRIAQEGDRETLIIPDHPELDTGTLRGIVRQASHYIPLDELQPHFFY